MTMTLVSTVTLSSATTPITFTSIPQSGTDLLIVMSVRDTYASGTYGTNINFRINSTATGYVNRALYGTGSTTASSVGGTSTISGVTTLATSASATANTFSSISIYIPNYSATGAKSISLDGVSENNATGAAQDLVASSLSDTAPVTSFSIFAGGSSFEIGSSASLYTISTTGATGAVVA